MSIKEQMLLSIREQAINNLVDKKFDITDRYSNGLITYIEYEYDLSVINEELDSLTYDN
jgi:hypothetical protein